MSFTHVTVKFHIYCTQSPFYYWQFKSILGSKILLAGPWTLRSRKNTLILLENAKESFKKNFNHCKLFKQNWHIAQSYFQIPLQVGLNKPSKHICLAIKWCSCHSAKSHVLCFSFLPLFFKISGQGTQWFYPPNVQQNEHQTLTLA